MENNIETQYAQYLTYLSRNDPSRVPMTKQEFGESFSFDTTSSKLTGVADPIHY